MNVLRLSRATAVLWIAVTLAACSTTRTSERAEQFATAGIAYTDAVPAVIDESFEIAVAADSIVLAMNRDLLPPEERLTRLEEADADFEERLSILRDLKRHAALLHQYFASLRALAQSDAATGITDSTTDLVDKLGALNPKIAAAQIGGARISDLIGPTVTLAVGAFKSATIRREIRVNGEAIERELALQRAALEVITDQMIADKDLEIQVTERNPIVLEYVEAGTLPKNWSDRRIAAYQRTIEIDSLKTAQQASAALHQAWIALAENRLDERGLLLLLQEINELADLAQSFATE